MRKNFYVDEMLLGIAACGDKGLISGVEGKRLCEDVLRHANEDMLVATAIEAKFAVQDFLESKGHQSSQFTKE